MVDLENYPTEEIHISEIKAGDAIIHNGKIVSVSASNIKNDSFMGRSVFGDSYRLGHKLVTRVIIPRFYKGEKVY